MSIAVVDVSIYAYKYAYKQSLEPIPEIYYRVPGRSNTFKAPGLESFFYFLRSFYEMRMKHSKLYLAFDSASGPVVKSKQFKEAFPDLAGYKSNRHISEKAKQIRSYATLYRKYFKVIAPYLGFITIEIPEEYEADDAIYSVVRTLSKDKNNQVTVFSNDSDLRFLVSDNVSVKSNSRGRETNINMSTYEKVPFKDQPINYNDIILYKMALGDYADGIPRIPSELVGDFVKLLRVVVQEPEAWCDPKNSEILRKMDAVDKLMKEYHGSYFKYENQILNTYKIITPEIVDYNLMLPKESHNLKSVWDQISKEAIVNFNPEVKQSLETIISNAVK